MKSQLLLSSVIYASITACGADSGTSPVTIPVTIQETKVEAKSTTSTEAKVEAKAEGKTVSSAPAPTAAQTSQAAQSAANQAAAQAAQAAQNQTMPSALKLVNPSCIDPALDEIKAGVSIMLCDGSVVTGTLVATTTTVNNRPADCSGNNEIGCVTTNSFKAADLTNLSASNVRLNVTIAGITGSVAQESHSDCSANNQTGCVATSSYKAANLTNLSASNVKSGVTLAGVLGTLAQESHVDCTSNNQIGCVSNSTYKAVDTTLLVAGNLKNGVIIAGVTGSYPSASAPLASATATDDLTAATFNLKIKSDNTFEYFDSTGARHTQTGNSALVSENIKSDVSLFNVSGTLEPATPVTIDAWDLRTGVTVAGVTGKLKTHCRTFDGNSGASVPTADKCLDAEIWTDMTSTVSMFSDCASASGECMFKNKVSGLYFSKGFAGADKTTAANGCYNLTFGGFDDWRLPSTEEAIQAATQGASSRGFLKSIYGNWTTNTYSGNSYVAIMSNGVSALGNVATSYPYFCVRK